MSNTIQPSYGTQTYSSPTKTRETKQTGTRGSSFMDMAAQASRSRADTFTTGLGGLAGMAAMPTSLMMDLAVRSGGQVQTGGTDLPVDIKSETEQIGYQNGSLGVV